MENQQACELCGKTGLSDDALRDHFAKNHVDGSPKCPFCGVTASSAELLIHVNTQHLDYLTPTSPTQNGDTDALNFIDDQTPSSYYSIDSDSMSEYRMSSPDLSNGVKVNGVSNASSETGINGSGSSNGVIRKDNSSLKTSSYVNGFGVASNSKSYEIQEQVPYSSTNGIKASNGETSTAGPEQGPQVGSRLFETYDEVLIRSFF